VNGRSKRTKGAVAERELAQILSDELGICVKRKLGQAREGGDDIQVGQFRIEAKRQEKIQIESWWEQVQACAAPDEIPVLAFRRSRNPWKVVLTLNDFIRMMREYL
jgi:Holliday junction resolvase